MSVLCRDCRFAKQKLVDKILSLDFSYAKCTNVAKEGYRDLDQDFVTGKVEPPQFWFCGTVRKYGDCGPEGKNFQPKGTPK